LKVTAISQQAHEKDLLTAAEVLEALGEPTAKVVDAYLESGVIHRGFGGSEDSTDAPEESPPMDRSVYYVLDRLGSSRAVVTYVHEYVTTAPDIEQSFAAWEALLTRHVAGERYDPAPIGIDALAYETDGGSGALDRIVVVNTGEALVVIEANPASPHDPEPDLTIAENLTRDQVDDLVRAAVQKSG
jgi:hypothetical protein